MLFDTCMFKDEHAMLDLRLGAFAGRQVIHVVTEAGYTHRGVPKPLELHKRKFTDQDVRCLVDDWQPDPDPWVNEHHQRNLAWTQVGAHARDDEWVLICDVDEIPSAELLDWLDKGPPWPVFSVPMRTFLFAVDWEVAAPVPPTCVAARAGFLRDQARDGAYLAQVRDKRDEWPRPGEVGGPKVGGWHFSWVGGPAAQAAKLDGSTCHTEILRTPEAELIRSGARWRSARNGGGLPVRPVDVDDSWPPPIVNRQVPAEWFRPREDVTA